jgi:hypothetical protein
MLCLKLIGYFVANTSGKEEEGHGTRLDLGAQEMQNGGMKNS